MQTVLSNRFWAAARAVAKGNCPFRRPRIDPVGEEPRIPRPSSWMAFKEPDLDLRWVLVLLAFLRIGRLRLLGRVIDGREVDIVVERCGLGV